MKKSSDKSNYEELIKEGKKALSLRDFTILLLTEMAKQSNRIDKDNRIAMLPVDYKMRIENILCAENGWKDKFSVLIDIDTYFDNHFSWENQLAVQINQLLQQTGKSFEYDFVNDTINICFTQKEIDLILSYYNDDIKSVMKHFAGLITSYIYTREYQEQFNDYSARSVKYMKKLTRNNKIKNTILF